MIERLNMYLIKNIRLYTGEETYENGAVLTDGDVVVYAGDESKMTAPPLNGKKITVLDGGGGICMPGLANTHTHAPMVLLRGLGSGLPLAPWLNTVMPIENKFTPDIIYTGTVLGIMEMLRNGVTAFADQYFHCDDMIRAVLDTGIRANISRGSSNPDGVNYHRMLLEKYADASDNLKIYLGLHAEYTSDEKTARLAAETAKELGIGVHVHVSESAAEVEGCIERHGMTPVRYFERLGLFDSPTLAAHTVHIDAEEREIFASHGVTSVHCPASNLYLGSGISDIKALTDAGVNVALGTDGAASNNTLDVFREMRLAALLAKHKTGDPSAISASEIIKMATVNGMRAMGFENTGLIKVGMTADLILLDGSALHLRGAGGIESDIVYSAAGGDVKLTMVGGRVLYCNGEYMTVDAERMRYEKAAVDDILRS